MHLSSLFFILRPQTHSSIEFRVGLGAFASRCFSGWVSARRQGSLTRMFIWLRGMLVCTLPPASRQMRTTVRSRGRARVRRKPAVGHALRWAPNSSRGPQHRQVASGGDTHGAARERGSVHWRRWTLGLYRAYGEGSARVGPGLGQQKCARRGVKVRKCQKEARRTHCCRLLSYAELAGEALPPLVGVLEVLFLGDGGWVGRMWGRCPRPARRIRRRGALPRCCGDGNGLRLAGGDARGSAVEGREGVGPRRPVRGMSGEGQLCAHARKWEGFPALRRCARHWPTAVSWSAAYVAVWEGGRVRSKEFALGGPQKRSRRNALFWRKQMGLVLGTPREKDENQIATEVGDAGNSSEDRCLLDSNEAFMRSRDGRYMSI